VRLRANVVAQNAVVFTELRLEFRMLDEAHESTVVEFCVTASVAVGSERDGQDATGQNSISEPIWRNVRTLRGKSRI
jgi:hypothetical protein